MYKLLYSNTKHGLERNTDHIATDSEKCEYLKHVIKKKMSKIEYPIPPQVSRYLGYNENLPYQQKNAEKDNEETTLSAGNNTETTHKQQTT